MYVMKFAMLIAFIFGLFTKDSNLAMTFIFFLLGSKLGIEDGISLSVTSPLLSLCCCSGYLIKNQSKRSMTY